MATAKSYNLLSQDEHINPNAVVVSEVAADVCDWNFKIYQDEECSGGSPSPLTLYFEGYFNPIDYEFDDEEEEDGFGRITLIKRTIRRVANFNLICDQLRNEHLHNLSSTKNIILEVRDGGEVYNILRLDIEKQGILDGYLIDNVVKLYFANDSFNELGMISCCRSAYTDAPFEDDCPDLPGGTVDGCGDFAVTIDEDGGELTAEVTDAPAEYEVNWLYRASEGDLWTLLVSDALMISLGAFGQYRAVAVSDGCTTDQTYLYQDPCASITVSITDNGVGLVAVGSGCDTPTYTWSKWDEEDEEWDEVFTGASYVPGSAGTYKVVMTGCDACAPEAIHEWSGETGCSIGASMTYVDGVLSVLHDACSEGTTTYEWYRDNGSGPVLVQSGLDPTLDVTSEGLYEVYVICEDGCSGYARRVVLVSETCVLSLSVGVSDGTATATLDGCGDDPATYTWFRNNGSGYNEVGTGNPFELPGTGLYKLVVACGECTKTIEFFYCPSDAPSDCQQSQYFEGFSGTDLTITEFDLPDTGTYSEEWIRDHLWVYRAGQKVAYGIGFTIDNGTNKIILSWDAEGEYIEVYFFADC